MNCRCGSQCSSGFIHALIEEGVDQDISIIFVRIRIITLFYSNTAPSRRDVS
jgi:hypothetical protein